MPDLNPIKEEYDKLIIELSNPELISDFEKFEELSKKRKKLEKIIEKQSLLEEIAKKLAESKEIIKSETDPDLIALAQTDITTLTNQDEAVRRELDILLKEEEQAKKATGSVIIEIRAGTGGDEAGIFAGNLYRMYSRFAEKQGWSNKVLDSHLSEMGGVKEIVFEIDGSDVYSKMKYEGGVHRVQRIPETEKAGRIHTSTASVAVLLKPKQKDIKIKPSDLKIDIAKASGPGGQNVNKRMTAVRITHLPTGIMVKSMAERSLPQNKENAMAILAAKLNEIEQEKQESSVTNKRREQIGKAKRVEKIRTYNFPQDRITDHRIKKNWHGIEEIMDGGMEKIAEAMQELDK